MSEKGDKGLTTGECNLPESKDSPFVEAEGAMDAFQSKLGWTKVKFDEEDCTDDSKKILKIEKYISEIMGALFTGDKWKDGDEKVLEIDEWIGSYTKGRVKNLDGFLLPGTNELESRVNICRTSCRTAERRIVTLKNVRVEKGIDFDDNVLKYFNRLSTYLFWMWQSKRD
jgi:cob(I)alamin adenosyltransferase